jgi:hypothetical protein
MRLQLDSSIPNSSISGPGEPAVTAGSRGADRNVAEARDSTSISGTSSILSSLSADRAARIQQLTSLVQSGTYDVPSASISRSIVGDSLS